MQIPGELPELQPAPARRPKPWRWIPSLYFAEGLPYVVVMTVSVILFKNMGISNTEIALYTSWLYLPWVLKPLWSPVVDILRTRRWWIWTLQLLIGAGLGGVALSIPAPKFFQYTLAFLWLLACSSATHDIAADGFYMLAATEKEQAFFVGIRNTFYRLSMITGQGLLVIVAGLIQSHTGLPRAEIRVEAVPNAAVLRDLPPNFQATNSPAEDRLRFLPQPAQTRINTGAAANEEIKSLLASAKTWNLDHHFVSPHVSSQPAGGKNQPSWWARNISRPLGSFLRSRFGGATRHEVASGNLGITWIQLNHAPGKSVVATPAARQGDKKIALIEGARLVFDDSNWTNPAVLVFQVDPKLRTPATAVFEVRSGNVPLSWSCTFAVLVAAFLGFGLYHRAALPRPASDRPGSSRTAIGFIRAFVETFGSFFLKKRIAPLLLFLLFYRFAEAQLVKLVAPFLLDAREAGGLGLATGQVGFVYGTIGVAALTIGGLLGGVLVSRHGLKFWLWPMVLAMHLPDAMFVYLAYLQPNNFFLINLCVALEQFGYGFGFTGYMLYMIYIARGKHETAHYAICTGFMALGMMLPGMFSGWLQELIGYRHFFIWVMLATIPGFVVAALVPLERDFGRKT